MGYTTSVRNQKRKLMSSQGAALNQNTDKLTESTNQTYGRMCFKSVKTLGALHSASAFSTVKNVEFYT